eukprot:m51a1_g11872 hypothetical protein (305) ;mRNA; r:545314-553539
MTQVWVNWVAVWDVGWAHTPKKGKPERERERLGVPSSPDQAPAPQASMACRSAPVEREAMAAAAAPAAEPELSPEPQQQQDIEPEKANEQPMEQDKNTEQQDGDTEQQDDAEAEQQDKQQDEQEENYRQATTPVARQDYDDTVVQAFIITISTLTRNRVIPTTEEAVQARTDCLEVMYFTTLFWDLTENTVQNSIKDKIKGAKQASKKTSSASRDDAESSSSESIDELQGKKVVECNVDDDQKEHKEKTTTRKRTREESNENINMLLPELQHANMKQQPRWLLLFRYDRASEAPEAPKQKYQEE